jgi:YD repeat-containing protein
MTTLTDTDGSQTIYTYDKANRKIMIQYPNSTGMRMTYDKAGHELTSIGGAMNSGGTITTTYSSFTYSYMAGSTQTALLQSVTLLDPTNWQNGTTYQRQYSYSKLNRLTDAKVFNSNNVKVEDYSYTYDAAGNRLTSAVLSTGISDSYTYNAANELTTKTQESTTTTYSYDGNGNLTGRRCHIIVRTRPRILAATPTVGRTSATG